MTSRPQYAAAHDAVVSFLARTLHVPAAEIQHLDLHEDGDECWAFYLLPDDTTSYVHSDLTIEWYGTRWGADEPEAGR